jgi:cytochrome oxidase assembly protein ShyY1
MGRYRFLLRPRWLLGHVLVLLAIVVMINLGFWQLHRLDEKRDRNATIVARQEEPVLRVDDVLNPLLLDDHSSSAEDVAYSRVSATGTYLADEQVLVRNRSLGGAPGSWVLTPLLLESGDAVVISRGWVPIDADLGLAVPPTGEVTVEGFVQATQERGSIGPTDPAEGELENLARVDVQRLQQQVDEHLLSGWVQLSEQTPAQPEDIPAPVPLPELDEGPHLGYAGQWFLFSVVLAVGYVVIIRRSAKEDADEAARLAADGDGGGDDALVPEPDGEPEPAGST